MILDSEEIWIYYPIWMKILCIFGIPALTGCSLWMITRPIWEKGLSTGQYLLGIIIGLAVLYQCTIGFNVLKDINTRILIKNDCIELHKKQVVQKHYWENLGPIKEFTFADTSRLSDKDGNVILFADNDMKNLKIIKRILAENHEV